MGWFWALVGKSNALAAPIVMLLYPLYASVMAIESPFKEDDQQWLTYWVLYSFVSLLEMAAAPVFAWIPLYSTIKLAVAAWLVLPQFRGGIILYEKFVRPHYYAAIGNTDNPRSKLTDAQRKWLTSISPETRSAVAKYVQAFGPEEFQKLVTDRLQDSRKHHGPSDVDDPKTRSAVAKYVQAFGPDEFQKLVTDRLQDSQKHHGPGDVVDPKME